MLSGLKAKGFLFLPSGGLVGLGFPFVERQKGKGIWL